MPAEWREGQNAAVKNRVYEKRKGYDSLYHSCNPWVYAKECYGQTNSFIFKKFNAFSSCIVELSLF